MRGIGRLLSLKSRKMFEIGRFAVAADKLKIRLNSENWILKIFPRLTVTKYDLRWVKLTRQFAWTRDVSNVHNYDWKKFWFFKRKTWGGGGYRRKERRTVVSNAKDVNFIQFSNFFEEIWNVCGLLSYEYMSVNNRPVYFSVSISLGHTCCLTSCCVMEEVFKNHKILTQYLIFTFAIHKIEVTGGKRLELID